MTDPLSRLRVVVTVASGNRQRVATRLARAVVDEGMAEALARVHDEDICAPNLWLAGPGHPDYEDFRQERIATMRRVLTALASLGLGEE